MRILPPALVIHDGGLGGLLACWSEGVCRGSSRDGKPVAWIPRVGANSDAAFNRRLATVRSHVELCQIGDIAAQEWGAAWDGATEGGVRGEGIAISAMLTAAAAEAAGRGLGRVIWPVQLGGPGSGDDGDLDAIADACDRSMLVGQLVGLDVRIAGGLRIELPYVDFGDVQMAELALDLGAPVAAAAWCEAELEACASGCAACRRWDVAFAAAKAGERAGVGTPRTSI